MGLTFNLGRVSPSVFTDSSLNVGIGAAPSGTYKLEVTGTAKVSSTLLVSGAATFSSSVSTGGALNITVPYSAGTMTILTQDNLGNGIYLAPRSNLNFDYGVANNTTGIINNFGYQNGSAHFRSLGIGDGKGGTIAFFDGVNSRVGIGTTSPNRKFSVNGDINATDSTNNWDMVLRATSTESQIRSTYSGAGGFNPMTFYTSDTERMRITSGGYLKVSNNGIYVDAVTSPQHEFTNSNSAERTLQANAYSSSSTTAGIFFTYTPSTTTNNTFYHISSYSGGGYKFRVADSGNVTNTNNSYTGISDIKLKENIIETSPKLDNLLKIRVVNYNLIGDNLKQIGVIAQELEQIFPSMIEEHKDFKEVEVTDKEGNVTKERQSLGTYTKAVKYSVFVPMLIKAIQEQNQIITSLQDRLDKAGL